MPVVKVLVVDDSMVFRESLSRSLAADPGISVIDTANDAFSAKDKILSLDPDVVILDVEMPKKSGIELLRELMPQHKVRAIVVTASPTSAFDALSAGAVDFVKKPLIKNKADMEDFSKMMNQKVKIAAIAKVKAPGSPRQEPAQLKVDNINYAANRNILIALGASTGGTDALQVVVKDLPKTTPGIVIVQHMPAGFTKMYAERLNKLCKMEVKEAEDGDRVETGKIIIGAGSFHLRLAKDTKGYYVTSRAGEKVSGHCPSVDVLFDSVADVAGKNAIAAILTGMGSDGAAGLKKARDKGAYTIGQDKDTCVVYGMPMVAYNIGAVTVQAPLQKIPQIILDRCKQMC